MPAGGSCWRRLKSRIKRLREGVDMAMAMAMASRERKVYREIIQMMSREASAIATPKKL